MNSQVFISYDLLNNCRNGIYLIYLNSHMIWLQSFIREVTIYATVHQKRTTLYLLYRSYPASQADDLDRDSRY